MLMDVESRTASAALAGRDALTALARAGAHDERRMAAVAHAAVFEEALLGALRARFGELRAVVK